MADQLPIDFKAILRKAESGEIVQVTSREEAVLTILRKGRENAISMPALAEALDCSTREVQSIIQHLINDHGVLIASACGNPHGYYIPETIEEFKSGARQIANRIISLAKRLRAMDREKYEAIFGQGNLLNDCRGSAPVPARLEGRNP